MTPGHIADAITASAKLKKWPSLNGERVSARDGAVPYTLVEASLADCIRRLATKPESQRHLYEIHTSDETVRPQTRSHCRTISLRPKNTAAANCVHRVARRWNTWREDLRQRGRRGTHWRLVVRLGARDRR